MANRFLQSLLGEEEYDQARGTAMNNAMLMAGLQGLLASGPSPMPVGLGQVIGQAGMTGLGAYGASMEQTGQQAGQLMELDSMRQEQARMEQEMEADEAFRLAAQEVMAGGRVNYNALQQLALAFPERAGPLISALQSARPPEAPQVNLQFDSRTGTIFNPRDGTVTMAPGFTPQEEPQVQIAFGSEISPALDANATYQRKPDGSVTKIQGANLTAPEREAAANPVLSQYSTESRELQRPLLAAENAVSALSSTDDFAVRRAAIGFVSSLGMRPRETDGMYEESGAYAELLRSINQIAGGGPITDTQRQQLATQIQDTQRILRNQQNRIDSATRLRLKNLGYSDEDIDVLTTGRSGTAPASASDLASAARAERERRQREGR